MNYRAALILILIVIIIAAGFFIWNRSQSVVFEGEPGSPVLVDILSPANGISINKNETLSILAQAWSTNTIMAMQLWEDGQMISEESVQGQSGVATYLWRIDPDDPGVHTYFVRARDTGSETGQSPTLILNVAADGLQQVLANAGDTLVSISSEMDYPIEQLSSLNPGFDPSQPLESGQPVILPPASGGGGEEASFESVGNDLVIKWQFTPTGEVDNSYCYQSIAGENWQRVPDLPFSFLPGDEWLQISNSLPAVQTFDLFLECWGWQGGVLAYLGEGNTSLNNMQIPDEIIIIASGFEAKGFPQIKPLEGDPPVEEIHLPAPFALRVTESSSECTSHGWSTQICDALLNGPSKEYVVLVWEWSPGFCWGACPWDDDIDGYQVSQSGPYVGAPVFKDISHSSQKVTAFPLPWGETCNSVRAYVEIVGGGRVYSPHAINCGMPPEPEVMVLKPISLVTHGLPQVPATAGKPEPGQAIAGVLIGYESGTGTYKVQQTSAGIKFALPSLPNLYRATLRFSHEFEYKIHPTNKIISGDKPFCANLLRYASGAPFHSYPTLFYWFVPFTSGPYYLEMDVTTLVQDWLDGDVENYGFVISPDVDYLVKSGVIHTDFSLCWSYLSNIELELQYFTASN